MEIINSDHVAFHDQNGLPQEQRGMQLGEVDLVYLTLIFHDLLDRFVRFIYSWHILHGKHFLTYFWTPYRFLSYCFQLQGLFKVLPPALFEVHYGKFI